MNWTNYAEPPMKFPELYNDPKYLAVLLHIFNHQKEKKSYITEITKEIFKPNNYIDITKTAEYIGTLRILHELENAKIIERIRPKKNERFKTHYIISLPTFVEHIIYFLKVLPTYTGEKDGWLKQLRYKENRHIANFLGMFYRGLAHDSLAVKIAHKMTGTEEISDFNLKDSIFMLIDKVITNRYPEKSVPNGEGEYFDGEQLLKEKAVKLKEREARHFQIFLLILRLLADDYRPYSMVKGNASDLYDYISVVINKKKYKEGDWEKKAQDVAEGKLDVFDYLPPAD